MVVLSVLRVAANSCTKLQPPVWRQSLVSLKAVGNNTALQPVRHAGHGRNIEILPSRFEWNKFKDHMHFYVMLGVVPLALITTYANLFIGDAELTDIPEGYEPELHEYYKHPVSRFFAKHLFHKPQRTYEMNMHYIYQEQEKRNMRALERKVKDLMQNRGDYKAWYYVPFNEQKIYSAYEDKKYIDRMQGRK